MESLAGKVNSGYFCMVENNENFFIYKIFYQQWCVYVCVCGVCVYLKPEQAISSEEILMISKRKTVQGSKTVTQCV